jgi:two-component system response regulator RegA
VSERSPNRRVSSDPAPTLLLVDDDRVLRDRLAQAFRERGFEVSVAGSYDEAMAASDVESPELVVVDLRMPGRSGLDLVRALKSRDPGSRIVVLTGYGSIATAIEAMRSGASHYLAKPADADEIIASFNRDGGASLDAVEQATTPTLARAEWEHIQRVLLDCAGNISEAARRLGIHRRSLQRKLHKCPPVS